jgi:aminopeptidase N
MKCVKDVSGKNMDWFFEQYFFRPGHPVLNVSKTWDETNKELKVKIAQKQDKWESVPIYTLPVRLGLYHGDKKVVKEFWIKQKTEVLTIPLDEEPDMVRFDEGNYLLKEWDYKKSLKELLFQVKNDDVPGRLWAVGQMSEYFNDNETVALWKKISKDDDFWGVRAAAIQLIGKYHGKKNVDILKRSAADENSKVRVIAIKTLGDLKDVSLRSFYKENFENDRSYAVKSEALIALGKCGVKKDIERSSAPHFSSRLGFILSALGIAIGTGNIWRFPRIVAQNGRSMV